MIFKIKKIFYIGLTLLTLSGSVIAVPIQKQEKFVLKRREKEVLIEEKHQNVIFTSYWTGDNLNSSACTGSGLCTDSFNVNEEGWYTYKGKVVVATATNLCYKIKTGACGAYNNKPKSFKSYDYFDEITLHINNKRYEAIVLDSCGACSTKNKSDSGLQRYDIFSTDSYNGVGKVKGKVIEKTLKTSQDNYIMEAFNY